jgi:2-(1,2-epoxy-1,2-dihydrophenyl)acetyl-CoA isomerase
MSPSPEAAEDFLVERSGGVVTATFNRPHRKNACTVPMFDAIAAVAREVRDNPEDRVLVLTGAGDAFCSGVDLAALPTDGTDTVRRASAAVVELHSLAKPTITALNGVAAGVGVGFALATDLVLAAESSRLIMSFVKRALSPDGGTSWLLPKLVGLRRAKEIAFFGDPVSSAQAYEYGLVNRVLPDAELSAEVRKWAERLADGPSTSLATTKAMINDAESSSLVEAVEREYLAQKWNASTKDFKEALAAFREKREPVFRKV